MKTKKYAIEEKYVTETESIPSSPGCWNVLKVSIFRVEGEEKVKIGEYDRNYSSFFDTFQPFTRKGQEYALYSKDYTATRVMSLPDCKDLGGEESAGGGFCPTEYFIPRIPWYNEFEGEGDDINDGQIGFVSGCYWGDDCSMKIQLLDLSRVEEGIVRRIESFGYIELLGSQSLRDAVDTSHWSVGEPEVSIACAKSFTITDPVDERLERKHDIPNNLDREYFGRWAKDRTKDSVSDSLLESVASAFWTANYTHETPIPKDISEFKETKTGGSPGKEYEYVSGLNWVEQRWRQWDREVEMIYKDSRWTFKLKL